MSKEITMHIRMPDNLLDALKKRVEKDGMTLSDEVRKACGKYLSEPDMATQDRGT